MPSPTTSAQLLSISTALVSAGGIATLSLFDVPELQSQPASRSLPSTRWLFSRGSHIFPAASAITSATFAYLAYAARPAAALPLLQVLQHGRVPGYIAAAVLTISIAPVTTLLMVPTNFRLIELNEELGGARSQRNDGAGAGQRSALESVDGKGQVNQFRDVSGPQGKTGRDSTKAEDEEVRELLGTFGRLNGLRALLMAAGGVVGLATALA